MQERSLYIEQFAMLPEEYSSKRISVAVTMRTMVKAKRKN